MTIKNQILNFTPVEEAGQFKGFFGAFNPRTQSWLIAKENVEGKTTVVSYIVKKDNTVITLGTKETRFVKKAQPTPDFPKGV
tara:strand:+ start:662 stop:907 length:246 start_codon:yes stop_codon:yes gene_type:complete